MSMENYVSIDRQELARLRADSAELARVRETVEIDMPYTLVNVPDSNENRVIGFRISKSDEAYGEMGLSEPLAWFRKWVGQIASSKGRRIPVGFALVPVEPTDGCRVEAGFEVIDRKHIPTVTIKMPPISAEDSKGWDRRDKVAQAIRAMLAAAPKGDSHE